MSGEFTINIRNLSSRSVPFYCFQQRPGYSNNGAGIEVSSCSLSTGEAAAYSETGSQLVFRLDAQVRAGARQASLGAEQALAAPGALRLGHRDTASTENWAVQDVSLSPTEGAGNHTNLSLNPVSLSPADHDGSLQEGKFGISVPSFQPQGGTVLYCGNACMLADSSIVLASYISPVPVSSVTCAPLAIFYVKLGSYAPGTVVGYGTADAAECDFSQGISTVLVEYQADGTFVVTPE